MLKDRTCFLLNQDQTSDAEVNVLEYNPRNYPVVFYDISLFDVDFGLSYVDLISVCPFVTYK